jgi:hypothetical protein
MDIADYSIQPVLGFSKRQVTFVGNADTSSFLDENEPSYSDNGQDQAQCGSKVGIGFGVITKQLPYVHLDDSRL